MSWQEITAIDETCPDEYPLPTGDSRDHSHSAVRTQEAASHLDSCWDAPEFDGIVGRSRPLLDVLEMVRTVAPTDCTVLIQGETGTGKERIARAIHDHSQRRRGPFVKLNCAAMPLGLLESELFGHEKGSFTGAVTRRIGRFEAAHRGTLFLDEVGDLPLELQAKLLRVLQESEFERLGSSQTQRVNVRLVAATNRDLEKLVAEKQFRDDLFYRLHVFPIVMPPLRERREDIPLLTRHFVQLFGVRMNKRVDEVPVEVVDTLMKHSWPGNIRELENFIARSVVLSSGKVLQPPLEQLLKSESGRFPEPVTLEEVERAHIYKALKHSRGKVGGPDGAAARLGIKRSTLYDRMEKLGVLR